jgi:hypothetical protein
MRSASLVRDRAAPLPVEAQLVPDPSKDVVGQVIQIQSGRICSVLRARRVVNPLDGRASGGRTAHGLRRPGRRRRGRRYRDRALHEGYGRRGWCCGRGGHHRDGRPLHRDGRCGRRSGERQRCGHGVPGGWRDGCTGLFVRRRGTLCDRRRRLNARVRSAGSQRGIFERKNAVAADQPGRCRRGGDRSGAGRRRLDGPPHSDRRPLRSGVPSSRKDRWCLTLKGAITGVLGGKWQGGERASGRRLPCDGGSLVGREWRRTFDRPLGRER